MTYIITNNDFVFAGNINTDYLNLDILKREGNIDNRHYTPLNQEVERHISPNLRLGPPLTENGEYDLELSGRFLGLYVLDLPPDSLGILYPRFTLIKAILDEKEALVLEKARHEPMGEFCPTPKP